MGFHPLRNEADSKAFEADAVGEFRKYLSGLEAWKAGSGTEVSVTRGPSSLRLSAKVTVPAVNMNPGLAEAGIRLAQRAIALKVLERLPREEVMKSVAAFAGGRPSFGGTMTVCRFVAEDEGISIDDLFDGFPDMPLEWTAWQEIAFGEDGKARVGYGFDLESPLLGEADRNGVLPFGDWLKAELSR